MKVSIIMALVGLLSITEVQAQIKNAKTETKKVYGNCGMCETAIEKAGSKSNLYKTEWNADTKMATITYNSKKITSDEVLKNIALSGYDNASFLAPDDAYNKLQGCCKYDREAKKTATPTNPTNENTMAGHAGHGQINNTMKKQEASQLKVVFANYFNLKDALVKTDGSAASVSGAALVSSLDAVEMGKLKMDEHTIWMKVEKALKFDAQQIKENKETEHQREHFISLSKNMYELIKVAKTDETVYYQHCPMANGGKGANWLSKERIIKNPYYGAQMLSCGKIIETIE